MRHTTLVYWKCRYCPSQLGVISYRIFRFYFIVCFARILWTSTTLRIFKNSILRAFFYCTYEHELSLHLHLDKYKKTRNLIILFQMHYLFYLLSIICFDNHTRWYWIKTLYLILSKYLETKCGYQEKQYRHHYPIIYHHQKIKIIQY